MSVESFMLGAVQYVSEGVNLLLFDQSRYGHNTNQLQNATGQ